MDERGPAIPPPRIDRARLPYRSDRGSGARARIGVVALATDHTMEEEWRVMLALDGVAFYVARLWNDARITPETLAALGEAIEPTTRLILPNDDRLDAVAFACTSGAMVLGEAFVDERVRRARPGIAVTDPMRAADAAMAALGLRRVALLTPYVDSINRAMRAAIVARGVDVPVVASLSEPEDLVAAHVAPDSLFEHARDLAREPDVDGVFVSCTSFRAAGIVQRLEDETGKPALASNHAMAWHALRLAGVKDAVPGYGRLFTL
jgi:maleate isomerase